LEKGMSDHHQWTVDAAMITAEKTERTLAASQSEAASASSPPNSEVRPKARAKYLGGGFDKTRKRSRQIWFLTLLGSCVLVPMEARAQTQGRVFMSADAGASWMSTVANSGSFSCVVVDSVNPTIVYACSSAPNGLFQSFDGGTTWSVIPSTVNVTAMTMSPSNNMILLAGTTSGIYFSVDQGQSWAPLVFFGDQVTAVAFDVATAPNTIYAETLGHLYVSRDAGATWSQTGPGGDALAVDPNNSGTVYAGTNNGVLVSTDYGGTWAATGPGPQMVHAILLDPTTPGALYAASSALLGQGRVFVSNNGGTSWSEYIVEPTAGTVSSLAITSDSSMLFAGVAGRGVFLSQDRGQTWSESDNGITQFSISSLAIAPGSPWTIFAGTRRGCTVRC
jgi:photosystem II stability/assembly factor-like uncharacterized protein